ncbi:hypothetical protein ARTB_08500 [Arthrobacter humicola]|nr:hypothetical protein [Arthrobacter humicola]
MGMANTRFGRNVSIDSTRPVPPDRILETNAREISRRLITRDRIIPATAGNALIAPCLQFMIRDWFNHGRGWSENPSILPTEPGDDWSAPQLAVFGTMNPGLVTLHNYPKHLQTFRRPDGQIIDPADRHFAQPRARLPPLHRIPASAPSSGPPQFRRTHRQPQVGG